MKLFEIIIITFCITFLLAFIFSDFLDLKIVTKFIDEKEFIKYCQKIVAKEKVKYSYCLDIFLWNINHVSDRMINRKFLLGCGTKEDIVSIKRICCKTYGQYLVENKKELDKESIKKVLGYCNLTKEDLIYLDLIYSEMNEETYQFFKENEKKYKVRNERGTNLELS